MKNLNILVYSFVILGILFSSCGLKKETFNTELVKDMNLTVDYIDNRMPSTGLVNETKYLSFSVSRTEGNLEHNWKTTRLEATSEAATVDASEFETNDFTGKDKPVYRNSLRNGLTNLSTTIDVSITLENEAGEKVKLRKTNVKLQVVQ